MSFWYRKNDSFQTKQNQRQNLIILNKVNQQMTLDYTVENRNEYIYIVNNGSQVFTSDF